jgi:hypothetical protein
MLTRILSHPPISGSITERHYNPFGSCTWVQFSSPEGEEWAGVFGNGSFGNHSCATVFNDAQSVMIGAGGNSYIVDLQSGALLLQLDIYTIGAIAIPARDMVIACDDCYLYALDSARCIWESDRVALDGIRLIEATEKWLNGEVWKIDGWYKFTLHLDSWLFEQGQPTGEK